MLDTQTSLPHDTAKRLSSVKDSRKFWPGSDRLGSYAEQVFTHTIDAHNNYYYYHHRPLLPDDLYQIL